MDETKGVERMKVNAFAVIPHVKNKGVEVELEIMPLVLCKDCEHCYFASNRIPSEQNYACGKHGFDVAPDWFCADGEEKEGTCNES